MQRLSKYSLEDPTEQPDIDLSKEWNVKTWKTSVYRPRIWRNRPTASIDQRGSMEDTERCELIHSLHQYQQNGMFTHIMQHIKSTKGHKHFPNSYYYMNPMRND